MCKWSNHLPDRVGYYATRNAKSGLIQSPNVVTIIRDKGQLKVMLRGVHIPLDKYIGLQWLKLPD